MHPTSSGWPRISSGVYERDPGDTIDCLCRSCGAVDPEGRLWWFSQRMRGK